MSLPGLNGLPWCHYFARGAIILPTPKYNALKKKFWRDEAIGQLP
jgi:hypothetical protein